MKHLISTQSLAAVAFALGAFAAASTAHARSDVYFSVDVQSPGFYVQPTHVHGQPRVVYMAPRPVYVEHLPVYTHAPIRYGRHERQYWERRGPHGDLDRDGIPNQYDRDRDGDGVRNRYDRLPDNPYRN